MADSSSETGSAPKTETELESNEDQDAVTEVEAGQKSDAEDDANSQAESEDPGETPPPPPPATPPRPNILMICLPSLSTEFPVLHTNTNLETFTKICTFPLKPGRILGEKGSVENVDDIVVELLEFIMKTSEDINVELFDLSIIFTGSDLGGVFVKKALVRAATDIKYRFIFTRTSLLFFFGTPHHASEVSSWEETLLRIAEDAYRGLRGPWFLDRIHQLSRYLEQLRLEFDEISDHFNIINYFQDMPESSTELLTVHKSCTELPRFNVTNIGVNVTHYELHCFISETAGEDFIVDRVSDTLMYEDEDFRQLVQWLSLESDGIETNFQIPGSLHNLANYIVHSVELEDSICNGEAQVISLEFEIEVDGRDFLSCLRDEIRRVLPPYPGTVIACTSMASTHSSSLTETGLLSSCIVQLLKQRPRLCGWLKVIKERVIYALRTQNTELRVRTLWECLRLIFARSSHFQGFWLLHTTGSQDQHELILRILKNLQYFDELDEISWKVIIVNNSASNINSLSSKSFSRVKLGYDTLGSSIERDVEARLDSIIQTRSITPSFKEKALRLFRNQPLNHKLLAFFMDTLQAVHPPIPEVLTDLTDSFSSINLAFHAILDRVPKHYQAWARKILGFLCFSWRPLSLDELGILIAAVDCKSLEQVRDNIGDSIGEHAQEVLPGIIRVTPENTFIIHDDFKSFLQQSPADAWYHPGDFHLEIATTSYNYLSFLLDQLVDVEPPRIESIVKWMLHARARPGNVRKTYFEFRVLGEDQYSEFVSYAARYWYDHLLHINDSAAAVGLSRSWLSNPDRLKEIIALRYHSMCQFGREFCAPKEFMPASVREAFNMSELEALKLTIQLIDRQASDKYIGIMYPPDSATNQVVRNWISLNLPPLSVPEIIACHPKEIERLFQHEEKAIRENLPDVLVSVVANNDRSLLVNFLEKVGEVGELAAKVLSYAIGWNMEDMAKALFEYLGIAQKGFWFKFDILEALSAAIATGNENMVKLLLDSGANINSQGKMRFIDTDSSPLIIASNFGLTNIVQLLLDRGAKVDLASQHGLTALHVASVRGFPSITKLLIDNRATIKLDSLQRSALHNAARYSSITRFKKIASLIVQALKDRWPRYEESGTQDAEEMLKITSARSGKKLKTALIYAAVAGDVSLVESLIDLGSDVDAVEVDGHTTLCRVGMVNDGVMTRFLIDNGAKVDYSRKDGRQPLHDACAWGASNSIEVLLEKNAVADHRDNDKIPPIAVAATWGIVRGIKQMIPHSSKDSISRALINAARYGYHEIVTALLDAGADINHQDDFGNTPLQFSCWNSNSRVTQMLLARMPDVNLPDTDKFTATVDAARRGHYECLKLLLDAGADMEAEAASGKRALIRAAEVDDDCFRLLLERGAHTVLPESIRKPNASIFKNGLSFLGGLTYAFKAGAVKVFLDYRKTRVTEEAFQVDINEALAAAAYVPKIDIIHILLEYGADPNAINPRFEFRNSSALGIAVAYDNLKIVEIFLSNKFTPVDVNKVDDYRNTPLHMALDWCVTSVLNPMIDLLLSYGADPTISSGTYGTVLNATCETSRDDIVRKIMDLPGVSPDIPDDLGRLPLHLAAARTSYETTRLDMLVTGKSTPESVDKQGRNTLHHAATSGWTSMLELLLTAYPELTNVPDRDGWTPLHWACRQDNTSMVELLIEHGADKQARTNDRWTPLHVAIYHGQSGHFECLPDGDDASDDENIPSQAAERIPDGKCDSCFCLVYGTGYRCGTCPQYWLCFKCYWHVEETHPKDHVFQRFDQESHDLETPSTDDAEQEDT